MWRSMIWVWLLGGAAIGSPALEGAANQANPFGELVDNAGPMDSSPAGHADAATGRLVLVADGRAAAGELLATALLAAEAGDRTGTRLLLERLVAGYPAAPEAAEAGLRLAYLHRADCRFEQALAASELAAGHPAAEASLAAEAAVLRGWLYLDRAQAQRAVGADGTVHGPATAPQRAWLAGRARAALLPVVERLANATDANTQTAAALAACGLGGASVLVGAAADARDWFSGVLAQPELPPPLWVLAASGLGEALAGAGDLAGAAAWHGRVWREARPGVLLIGFAVDPAAAPKAGLREARALCRLGRTGEAMDALQQLARSEVPAQARLEAGAVLHEAALLQAQLSREMSR